MPPPATFAGMIRLIACLALAAFFAAPALAQADDLPPLPTRAEVLAEIEAALTLEGPESRGFSIDDYLWEWDGFYEMRSHSRRLALLQLALYREQMAGDEPLEAISMALRLPGVLHEAGETRLARDVILEFEAALNAVNQNGKDQTDVVSDEYWQDLLGAAVETEQPDLALRYSRERLIRSSEQPLRQRLDIMADLIYEQMFQRNSGGAYQQSMEAINLILDDPALNPFLEGNARTLDPFIENAALIESPDDLALLQEWVAISERLGGNPASIYLEAAQWYTTADFGPQARMASELSIRAMLSRRDARDPGQLYRTAQFLAEQQDCDIALAALELADVWSEIYRMERLKSRVRLAAERRMSEQNTPSSGAVAEGDRIIISGGHYTLPSRLPTGRRFLVLANCRTMYEASGVLLDELVANHQSIADFGQDLERQFETRAERLALREALGRQIRPDAFMGPYIDSQTLGSFEAIADMTYISMALRAANRTPESDNWLERAWAEYQSYDGWDRRKLLAWLALALPE